MWTDVRNEALNILRSDMTSVPPGGDIGQSTLDDLILKTGYPWALKAHEKTTDLLAVYAATLRNGGGPGPAFAAFSQMIAAAVSQWVVNNRITQPLNTQTLAQASANHLVQPSALPLAVAGSVDYVADLLAIAEGRAGRARALMPALLQSVVDFSEMLVRLYNGSAVDYNLVFNRPHMPSAPGKFVFNRFMDVAPIPKIGVALAMNFFKDSQVPALNRQPLQNLYTNEIGWYVKPDIHVLRFMLKASGRANAAGVIDDSLVFMKEGDVRRCYVRARPASAWAAGAYTYGAHRPKSELAQWQCIEDVHRLARHIQAPPLEIDRIFFMVGSGRFYSSGRIAMPQEQRYKRLFSSMKGL